jgi:protein phosphatase
LFDIDVAEVRSTAIAPGDPAARRDVCSLGRLLSQLTPRDQPLLHEFVADAADDVVPGALAFQRERRGFARETLIAPTTVRHASLSVVGRKRSLNEDSWAWRRLPQADVYVVADGMGGYEAGDAASAAAIASVLQDLTDTLPPTPPEEEAMQVFLDKLFERANQAVRTCTEATGPVGTTLVMAIVWPKRLVHIAHIGDSRAYSVTSGKLTPISEDHSMVAAMVATGKIDRETARTHPRSNVLIQFLGNSSTPEPDLVVHQGKPDESILLCTDGLWGELPEERLNRAIQGVSHARRRVRAAVSEANDAGGKDNITAVLVEL